MNIPLRALLALAPLLLTVLFGFLLMEGHLSLGSGEKDLFLLVPLLLWSFAYLGCYLFLWWRRAAPRRAFALSAGIATGFVVIAWLILVGVVFLT